MALKLYGGKDTNTPLEFMVRANSLEEAQESASILKDELTNVSSLVIDDFSPPHRLNTSLITDPFPVPSIVNGGVIESVIRQKLEVYEALRLDGTDNTSAITPRSNDNDLDNDFQIIAWIEFISYEGAAEQVILSQWDPSTTAKRFRFLMNNDSLQFDVSSDGTNIFTISADIEAVHDTGFWVRSQIEEEAGGSLMTLYTSSQNRFVEPENLTWTLVAEQAAVITTLNQLAPIDMLAGGDGNILTDVSNVPNGSIGRILYIAGISEVFSNNTISNDMYPDRDYVSGTTWTSASPQLETWTLEGRANVGIPIVGGGTIAFEISEGNYLQTFQELIDSITGTISLAVWIEFIELTPLNVTNYFMGKGNDTFTGNSFGLGISGDVFTLGLVGNGLDTSLVDGDIPNYVVGEGRWLALTYIPITKIMNFYTSEDAINTPYADIEWTLKAVGLSTLAGSALLAASGEIYVGAFNGEKSPDALIARALIISGELDGTLEQEMYPDRDYTGGTTMTSSTTSEIWALVGDVPTGQV